MDDDNIAVAWTGRTWQLRAAFDDYEIPLAIEDGMEATRVVNGDAGKVGEDEPYKKLLEVFGSGVLHNGACIVRVSNSDAAAEDSAAKAFVEEIRAFPHLAFLDP